MATSKNSNRLRVLHWATALLMAGAACWAPFLASAAVRPSRPVIWAEAARHIIVHYRSAPTATLKSNTALHALSAVALMPLTFRRVMGSGSHVLQLPHAMTLTDAQQVARRLAKDPNVLYAEPSYPLHIEAVPNDPLFRDQWALVSANAGIDMENAWNITQGSPSIVMAVLDTGILKNHPEFQGRLLPGYNFISDPTVAGNGIGRSADPEDLGDFCTIPPNIGPSSWHGSNVAGIMGARAGNGSGIAGIDPRSMILPVRMLGRCGGDEADAVDALRWAAGMPVPGVPNNPHPARVINMSLGESGACPQEMQSAVDDARARNAVVVVAAGNGRDDDLIPVDAATQFPANCKGVTVVAATNALGNRSSYSNFGSIVTISAPGDNILSASNTGQTTPAVNTYAPLSGTSQATPHVSGVLALMLSINPRLTPSQLTNLLIRSRRPFPAGANCAGICPAGKLDAYRAVLLARASLRGAKTGVDTSAAMTVSAGPMQTLRTGQVAVLHGSVRPRPPATLRTLHWMQLGGPRVVLNDSYAAQPRFVTPMTAGVLVFQLTAVDSQGQVVGSKTYVNVVGSAPRTAGQSAGTRPVQRH